MTATDIAILTDEQIVNMSLEELKSLKRAANHAYSVVGDSPKFNTANGQNLLKWAADRANDLLFVRQNIPY